MRPEFGPLLQAVQASFAQNQLRFCDMAKIEALRDAAPTVLSVLRTRGVSAASLALGLLAAAALCALAVTGGTVAESIVLGLLALLAVAGVVLVLGLLSGFL